MEQITGFEPMSSEWKFDILPTKLYLQLRYTVTIHLIKKALQNYNDTQFQYQRNYSNQTSITVYLYLVTQYTIIFILITTSELDWC